MTRPGLSEIVIVLDRSGSMQSTRRDMEGAFDAFIAQQRDLPGRCEVTLVRFDNEVDQVYEGLPLAQVPPLDLEPRGSTALYDAIGYTIDAVSKRLDGTDEAARPERVLVVIITDGGENASRTYDRERVLARIGRKRTTDGWEFVYLGANQDAFAVGRSLGIDHAYGYISTPQGTRDLMTSVAHSTRNYRAGQGYTVPGPPSSSEPGGGNGETNS